MPSSLYACTRALACSHSLLALARTLKLTITESVSP